MKRATIKDTLVTLSPEQTDALCNAINAAPEATVYADANSLPYFTATWAKTCAEVMIDGAEETDAQGQVPLEAEERAELEALKSALHAITLAETEHAKSTKAEERLEAAVEAAQEAFWAAIAAAYPEAETGDLDPLEVGRIEDAMTRAARTWVEWNTAAEVN